MENLEFKNEIAERLTSVMLDARSHFRGVEFREVMSLIANKFPEDRFAILTAIGFTSNPLMRSSGTAKDATREPGGNVKIEDDCPGCPGKVHTDAIKGKPLKAWRAGVEGNQDEDAEADKVDTILVTYQNDTDKLLMRASQLGLKLGNMKDPKKIAQRIADKLNEEE